MVNAADAKMIKELKGHAGRIHALAFSPKDGNLIVSASADKTAKLWDVNQGKSVRDFAGHGDAVLGVNVSRDGTKLVTGSADKTARIWNLADGKTLATLSGHAGPVTSVFLADDASRVATGSADQSVRIWDAASGRELQRMSDHRAALAGVALLAGQQVGRLGGGRQRRPGVGSGRRAGFRRPSGADLRAWPFCRMGPSSTRPRPTSRSRSSTSRPAISFARSPGTRAPSRPWR